MCREAAEVDAATCPPLRSVSEKYVASVHCPRGRDGWRQLGKKVGSRLGKSIGVELTELLGRGKFSGGNVLRRVAESLPDARRADVCRVEVQISALSTRFADAAWFKQGARVDSQSRGDLVNVL
jgi:hypothetical protein